MTVKKHLYLLLLVFVFVLVTKGWDADVVNSFVGQHDWEELEIKTLQFQNRKSLEADAFYVMGGHISFFKPTNNQNALEVWLEHELCHHNYRMVGLGFEECHG